MSFRAILEKYRQLSFSERDKGNRFERLMQAYLYTDPKYTSLIDKVWLWSEFPHRSTFGGQDVGIDLVAMTVEGDYWAIQCKCYREEARIDKAEVDTFLSTSGRSFEEDSGEIVKFSQRLWISTTNNWSSKANESLRNQQPGVTRLNLHDLMDAPVDWELIDDGIFGERARVAKKILRPHQTQAAANAIKYFEKKDRGKMIMACGTGKTFTSLRIAEQQAGSNGVVLFLVPSISLLGQTLREWTADAQEGINAICICSDSEVTKEKKKNEDTDTFSIVDLALPASTNSAKILKQFEFFEMTNKRGLTVVFSTYQSIEVIARTQQRLESIGSRFSKFDLIICDEAHRTTGVTLVDDDESAFVKVHDNSFINASKRLYMTATPRLYGEESKIKAAESAAILCSMDDEALYGKEFYRIGFGEAVERDLLSDYKVLILTLSEDDITPEVQSIIKDETNEISTDDISKLIGCVNAMSKQILGDKGLLDASDPDPMRRAVAFCRSIKASKKITSTFNIAGDTYLDSLSDLKKRNMINLKSDHIDGTMSATERDTLMSWLKEDAKDSKESRVLTNVRCLSEGVDVPSLDAVMFLSARNSQVDVVQSVGRVMRKNPGKKYGYIIIPVVVPTDIEPEKALDDNERYKVVWTVLNALRAHDDRFNATVNKIDLNKKRPEQILVGRIDPDGDGDPTNDPESSKKGMEKAAQQTAFHFNELQNVIYAKLVQKVGDRQYWENWAKSVADIAERQIKRITKIVEEDDTAHMAFREFVRGLRKNINPSVTEHQAIEMLSQHIITKPVFEALFEGYSFVQNNAVSISMQKALDAIEAQVVEDVDAKMLESFYESVRKRAEGIDNSAGKQRIVAELYEKFFKSAFPQMVDQLGIVYTPPEVVDFIIHSVNDVLQKEFGRSLSDENVNILDPFTGTGTFITRLLQTGVIRPEDLERKYQHEIFANEIVLLAYYIAAVNIENAYHDLLEKDEYESFEGIVLTDTFQLSEEDDNTKLFSEALAENSERLQRQKNAPLRVILGNPPYSVGQTSANDNAQNQKYGKLDSRIAGTYAKLTDATNKNSLYDSYIKAFRWATDRLSDEGGVVGFVSNGSWIDGNAQNGMRKSLEREFTSVHVFNLRGNQRTSGDLSRREGGKIFGSGSRTPIAITLLVKNPDKKQQKADIYYHDIGDYLNREQKLQIIKDFGSTSRMEWLALAPDQHGDWLNLRKDEFDSFTPMEPVKKYDGRSTSYFVLNSRGFETSRDAWIYSFGSSQLADKMKKMISFYNGQIEALKKKPSSVKTEDFVDKDPTEISWSSSLFSHADRGEKTTFEGLKISTAMYRPFQRQHYYHGSKMVHRRGQADSIFPGDEGAKNVVICVSGPGVTKDFSALITNVTPDLELVGKSQCFPLYYYEVNTVSKPALFGDANDSQFVRHDGVSDFILKRVQTQYGDDVSKEAIFYYVYGLLHSQDYRSEFANDLKKQPPRLPLVDSAKKFWAFSKAGRKLADLHINYEKVTGYQGAKVNGTQHNNYIVEKMRFAAKGQRNTILYNTQIKIENIPEKAYKYIVNGKSAIEWIMERYQITKDKDSGFVNDPNDWAKESKNPRYILDLLLSVINLSVQTVDIVNNLPKLTFTPDEGE
jgi:predicted helicase